MKIGYRYSKVKRLMSNVKLSFTILKSTAMHQGVKICIWFSETSQFNHQLCSDETKTKIFGLSFTFFFKGTILYDHRGSKCLKNGNKFGRISDSTLFHFHNITACITDWCSLYYQVRSNAQAWLYRVTLMLKF